MCKNDNETSKLKNVEEQNNNGEFNFDNGCCEGCEEGFCGGCANCSGGCRNER